MLMPVFFPGRMPFTFFFLLLVIYQKDKALSLSTYYSIQWNSPGRLISHIDQCRNVHSGDQVFIGTIIDPCVGNHSFTVILKGFIDAVDLSCYFLVVLI